MPLHIAAMYNAPEVRAIAGCGACTERIGADARHPYREGLLRWRGALWKTNTESAMLVKDGVGA